MIKDTQGPKWQITINNPADKGLAHEAIKERLQALKSVKYWCMSDETGVGEHTLHTHVFLYCSKIRFSTIKRLFPEAHIEQAYGTAKENRDYISKSGKWAEDEKAESSIAGTYEEWGELPEEPGAGYRSDIAELYYQIEAGHSNAEIMEKNPETAQHIGKMDKIRQDIMEARYREIFREITVTYIYGPTETGKTRGIYAKHGYSSVYRVTDYRHPFDRYSQEAVLCLDEFRSSLPISEMLNYLDGYPISLPARYAPRVACYETVYIISNIELKEQYKMIQKEEPETWAAFLRRIDLVVEYQKDGPPLERVNEKKEVESIPPQWVQDTEKAGCEEGSNR